jgi:hypothetical protein
MAWKFPWKKSDPIERRRQELEAESERITAAAEAIFQEMDQLSRPPESKVNITPSNPIWAGEDTEIYNRMETRNIHREPRTLQAHRERDRNLFLLFAALFLLLVSWLIWG